MRITGIVKIDKEQDYTSQDVDAIVKKRLNQPKAGHLGTLDPFATGLLLVAVNDATKITRLIPDQEKEYVATLKLGSSTPSFDPETEINEIKDVPPLNKEKIQVVLSSFLGKQMQTPPLYSARHYNGKKGYALAREGSNITLPAKEIEIFHMELLGYDDGKKEITFSCLVSKGTYIRALGRDIAIRLGTVGYLTSLRRTMIGPFTLDGSVKVKDVTEKDVRNVLSFLPGYQIYPCDETLSFRVSNGQTLKLRDVKDDYLLMVKEERLLAVYQKDRHVYHCMIGLSHD